MKPGKHCCHQDHELKKCHWFSFIRVVVLTYILSKLPDKNSSRILRPETTPKERWEKNGSWNSRPNKGKQYINHNIIMQRTDMLLWYINTKNLTAETLVRKMEQNRGPKITGWTTLIATRWAAHIAAMRSFIRITLSTTHVTIISTRIIISKPEPENPCY